MRLSPDQIAGSAKGIQIVCRVIDRKTVLIEGSGESLEFLGKLLVAQAQRSEDCRFQLDPQGPGSAHFAREATHGIYIHRLPCSESGHRDKAR